LYSTAPPLELVNSNILDAVVIRIGVHFDADYLLGRGIFAQNTDIWADPTEHNQHTLRSAIGWAVGVVVRLFKQAIRY
jgi:hypothetical protein